MDLDIDKWVAEEMSKLTPDSDRFYESGDPSDFPKDWFDGDELNVFAPIRAHLLMIKWRRERDGGSGELSSEGYDADIPVPAFPKEWEDEEGNLKPWAPLEAHLKSIRMWRRNIAASDHGYEDIF